MRPMTKNDKKFFPYFHLNKESGVALSDNPTFLD